MQSYSHRTSADQRNLPGCWHLDSRIAAAEEAAAEEQAAEEAAEVAAAIGRTEDRACHLWLAAGHLAAGDVEHAC